MALVELLHEAGSAEDLDFLRERVHALSQAVMELEVSQHLGADRQERTPELARQCNGYREGTWDT